MHFSAHRFGFVTNEKIGEKHRETWGRKRTNCESVLSSEFCISIDRIKENAVTFGRSYESELHRVIIHGVLHLIGFDDLTDEEEKEMREKEEEALKLLFS